METIGKGGNIQHSKLTYRSTRDHYAYKRLYYQIRDTRLDVGDAKQSCYAESGIYQLGAVYCHNIPLYSESGEQEDDEYDRKQGINYVYAHRVYLLSQPLQHSIGCRIKIHNGYERCYHSYVSSRVGVGIYGISQLVCKAGDQPCRAYRKQKGDLKYVGYYPAYIGLLFFGYCLRYFGHEESRKRGEDSRGEEDEGKYHAVYRSVCGKRARS